MDNILRDDIRFINKFLYSIQKHRIALQNWIDAKNRDKIEVSKRILQLQEDLESQEKTAKKMAKDIVVCASIWDEFFENIRGVGECLSTSLIADIGDISKFPTISSLWAYAGLTCEYVKAECSNGHKIIMSSDKHKICPIFENKKKEKCGGVITIIEKVKGKAPKRIRGHHYLFNNRLKMTCWKIGEQLVKQGDDYYREIYYKEKEKQQNLSHSASDTQTHDASQIKFDTQIKNAELTKLHIHNRAKRKMVKRFLANLWEAWRVCEGLEIRLPYVIEKLGHQGYIKWAELKQILIDARGKNKQINSQ